MKFKLEAHEVAFPARRILRVAVILLAAAFFPAQALAQAAPNDETLWKDFLKWYENNPRWEPVEAYRAKLLKDGVPEDEATRRAALMGRLATERPEALAIYFNDLFTREKPIFRTEPNALLMETIKGLTPGRALDVAMGQGRNAIWLAEQGWDVTGFDVSAEGLDAARATAEKKQLKVKTVHSSWQAFDFGREQWDLIVLSYAFVPLWDPAFYERLRASLKSGGIVVFEHFLHERPYAVPRFTGAPQPNELLRIFVPGFRVLRYEDVRAVGDWRPGKEPLARMVARKL